jgi:hypothetical protein
MQFLLFTATTVAIFLLLPLHARHAQNISAGETILQGAQLRNLRVTDLCLTTEARYTRHPAMADRHAPFQEHPVALEHFPSGSLILQKLQNSDNP